MRVRYLALVFGVGSVFVTANAAELPTALPEQHGMSAERLVRVRQAAQRFVDRGTFPGAVTAVARNGKLVHLSSVGTRGVNDPRPMPTDGLFRMYSSTKIVMAVAMMQLYEEGRFQLFDPVSKFVPELAALHVWSDAEQEGPSREITIHQLLTHTSGLSYGIEVDDPVDRAYLQADLWQSRDLNDFAQRVSRLPLRFEPGTQWRYSIGLDIAGLIVERISGMPLDQYLKERLFDPLGMPDTGFTVPEDKLHRLLPHHILGDETREVSPEDYSAARNLPGGIFTHGCAALCNYRQVTLYSGGGGLVSTVSDYLRFGEMLRNGGELDGVRILSPVTVDYMVSAHVREPLSVAPSESFGLGVGVHTDPVTLGVIGTAGEFYHDGAGGTVFWIDPVEELVVLGMIQVLGGHIWKPDLRVAVYQAVTESYR